MTAQIVGGGGPPRTHARSPISPLLLLTEALSKGEEAELPDSSPYEVGALTYVRGRNHAGAGVT
jgi:hypothetical protein